jgi:hypothetical protein
VREWGPQIILSLLVAASLGAMVDQAPAESSFTDEKKQFRLTLPAGWKFDPDKVFEDHSFIDGPR